MKWLSWLSRSGSYYSRKVRYGAIKGQLSELLLGFVSGAFIKQLEVAGYSSSGEIGEYSIGLRAKDMNRWSRRVSMFVYPHQYC